MFLVQAREYVRALNAAKLEKVFAKPFVGSLGGHADSVWSMATVPTRLTTFLSGGADGGKLTMKLYFMFLSDPERKFSSLLPRDQSFGAT